MDPNANLIEQLKLARKDWTGKDTEDLDAAEISRLHDDHIRLCDLVESLDQWIRRGGFLPSRWATGQEVNSHAATASPKPGSDAEGGE